MDSTAIAIGLEFVVWFVPSLIGSALCFSLVGVAIGPMYPSCVMIITEVMPSDLHTGTIGFIACFGVVGSAIMPFITGAIANQVSLISTCRGQRKLKNTVWCLGLAAIDGSSALYFAFHVVLCSSG